MKSKLKSILFTVTCFSLISACGKTTADNSQKKSDEAVFYSSFKAAEITAESWKLPELTQLEKQQLVNSVKIVFNDFYVHRTQKKNELGFDSVQAANKLSADMSSETLLRSVNSIFNNIRDLHTGFKYPAPARCVIGGFPLTADLAYESGYKSVQHEKLIISNKVANTLESKFATSDDKANYLSLKPGDEIIAITNLGLEGASKGAMSAADAIKTLSQVSRGANSDAAKSRAVQILFSRNGSYMKPPGGRFSLTVKKASDQKIVTYEFPWLAYSSSAPACVSQKEPADEFNTSSFFFNNSQLNYDQLNYGESFKDIYADENAEENISKSIIESAGHKKFALVHINLFVPQGISVDENYLVARKDIQKEVNELRSFILNNKDSVEGVIIDVRGNGGGYGSFPQLIANMFTKEFVSNMSVQPLVSQVNRDTFHNLEFSRFYTRQNTADPLVDKYNNILAAPVSETANEMDSYLNKPEYKNSEILLSPVARFDADENDELPPEYNAAYKKSDTLNGTEGKYTIKEILTDKPIAVLTNSNCYSACDIFTSIFKDYNIAKIIGETAHTGGGGANVIEWHDFLTPVLLDDKGTTGSIIPNGKPLPRGSEIRFAWNRIVRENARDQVAEKYIEGSGVLIEDENIFRPSVKDILNDSSEQLNKIMNDMLNNRSSYNTNR